MLEVVRWCSDNQSLLLHRFRGSERRRHRLFLHRSDFAPAAAVDREPGMGCRRDADGSQAVTLEAAAGSQEERRAAAAGRRYPPSLRYGWDDMSVWLAEIFF